MSHGAWVRQNGSLLLFVWEPLQQAMEPLDAFRLLPSAFGPSYMVQCPELSHRPKVTLCAHTSLSMLTALHHRAEPAQC